ncbi:MAG: OmpA family protein [Candidatus Kapabacteria bacterium]|nr:OmpA family protein [Candidatus Kapabacteria bacterium]
MQWKTHIQSCLFAMALLLPISALAQSDAGRAGFGFNAGAAKYFGEFSDNSWWLGGDIFFRYNMMSYLSLQAQFAYANPRFRVNVDNNITRYTDYFGGSAENPNTNAKEGGTFPNGTAISGANENNRNNTRIFSYEVLASLNLLPGEKFVPYIFGGVGLMSYQVRPGLAGGGGLGPGGTVGVLPGQSAGLYKTEGLNGGLVFPVGGGFELYLSDDLVLNGRATYRFTGTDYLDDYKPGTMKVAGNPGGAVLAAPSGIDAGGNDAFFTTGLGFTYYVFGDADFDKDGISNAQEKQLGTDENNPDTDGDGLPDGYEYRGLRNTPKGFSEEYIAALPKDAQRTDPKKPDTDGDGLNDKDEIVLHKTNPISADTDGDRMKDGEEIARKTNPLNADTDGDGLIDGDEVDTYKTDPLNTDTDKDGLTDGDEVKKYSTSPTAADTDKDGINDGEEVNKTKTNPTKEDSDSDGLTDGAELQQYKTNPTNIDSDGDGLNDGEEVNKYKTNPNNVDTDADGLKDGEEVNTYKTNPANVDSDGDKVNDGEEVNKHKTNPTNVDSDGDGLKDGEEINGYGPKLVKTNPNAADTDGDKLSDAKEQNDIGTDPNNPDTDGDTVKDGDDGCPLTPGIAQATATTRAGCPEAPKIKIGTKTDFPDILFIVNTDEFNYEEPGTRPSLAKLLEYVNQCDNLQVGLEGHASSEGNPKRNQELSDLRAKRVKTWLIEQGVKPEKLVGAIGYGSSQLKVQEPTAAAAKKMKKEEVEAVRKQNRRITVVVKRACD